jgi:hypothetical protein
MAEDSSRDYLTLIKINPSSVRKSTTGLSEPERDPKALVTTHIQAAGRSKRSARRFLPNCAAVGLGSGPIEQPRPVTTCVVEFFCQIFSTGLRLAAARAVAGRQFRMHQPGSTMHLRLLREIAAWMFVAVATTVPVFAADTLVIDSPTTLALGDVAEGVVYTSAGYPAAENGLEKFYGDYIAKFGGNAQTDVGPCAATAYESVKLIEAAVVKTDSTDGAAIRHALEGIADFRGITGSRITLASANRIALSDVALIRIEKGRKTLVEMLRPSLAEMPALR